jgi:hypothetical protein
MSIHVGEIKPLQFPVSNPTAPVGLLGAGGAILKVLSAAGVASTLTLGIVVASPANPANDYCTYTLNGTEFPVAGVYTIQLVVTYTSGTYAGQVLKSNETQITVGASL